MSDKKTGKSTSKANANRVKKAAKKIDTSKGFKENAGAIGGVVKASATSAKRASNKKQKKLYVALTIILIIAIVAVIIYGYYSGWFDALLGRNPSDGTDDQTLTLDKTSVSIGVGDTVQLSANLSGTVTWSTSDPNVATVEDGLVTGVAAGHATVTATLGNKNANCNVTVTDGEIVVSGTNLSIHFLELGNKFTGDCIYIKAGDTDILIDAGSRNDSAPTLIKYIDNFVTDNKLEYVIATHAHEDHIGAFYSTSSREGIFAHYKTDTIIDFALSAKTAPGMSTPGSNTVIGRYLNALQGEIDDGATHYTAAQCFNETDGARRIYEIADGITMEILYNYYYFNYDVTGTGRIDDGENNYSVCILITQGSNHYLFTGDLEDKGERKMVQYYQDNGNPLPHCVLYKAGHHGSGTSTTAELLEAITPEYCCICTCCGTSEYTSENLNQFPYQSFVDRIAPYTENVYLTTVVDNYVSTPADWKNGSKGASVKSMNGNIVFSCDGSGTISLTFSNNDLKLKDTQWFKEHRTTPEAWQNGTSMYR